MSGSCGGSTKFPCRPRAREIKEVSQRAGTALCQPAGQLASQPAAAPPRPLAADLCTACTAGLAGLDAQAAEGEGEEAWPHELSGPTGSAGRAEDDRRAGGLAGGCAPPLPPPPRPSQRRRRQRLQRPPPTPARQRRRRCRPQPAPLWHDSSRDVSVRARAGSPITATLHRSIGPTNHRSRPPPPTNEEQVWNGSGRVRVRTCSLCFGGTVGLSVRWLGLHLPLPRARARAATTTRGHTQRLPWDAPGPAQLLSHHPPTR
jgi:hypothetical protein